MFVPSSCLLFLLKLPVIVPEIGLYWTLTKNWIDILNIPVKNPNFAIFMQIFTEICLLSKYSLLK